MQKVCVRARNLQHIIFHFQTLNYTSHKYQGVIRTHLRLTTANTIKHNELKLNDGIITENRS